METTKTQKEIDEIWDKSKSIVDDANARFRWAERYLQGKPFEIRFRSHSFHNRNFHIEITGPEFINYSDSPYHFLCEIQKLLKEVGLEKFGKLERYFWENSLGDRFSRGLIKLKA